MLKLITIDKRELRRKSRRARRAKYRLMAHQSCQLVDVASEYAQCSRVASVHSVKDYRAKGKTSQQPHNK